MVSELICASEPASSIRATTFFRVLTTSSGKIAMEAGAGFSFTKTPLSLPCNIAPATSWASRDTGRLKDMGKHTKLRHRNKMCPKILRTRSSHQLSVRFGVRLLAGKVLSQRLARNVMGTILDTCEIDVPFVRIGADQLGANLVGDIESVVALR